MPKFTFQLEAVLRHRTQLEQQRQRALADAAKYRKVIEKLKERHRDRWLADLARRELTESDEIGMQLTHWHSDDAPDAAEPNQPVDA